MVGLFDTSHPQPWDNSHRLYTADDHHITRPLVRLASPAVGLYSLSGESVVQFPTNQEKERICECLEEICEQNPGQRILLVLNNFFITCVSTRASESIDSASISYFAHWLTGS